MSTDGIGGVWTFSLELARGLAAHGIEVAIASMGGALTEEQQADALSLPNVTLFQSTCKLEWMDSPWEDVRRAGEWMLELEADLSPDLVHLNGYCHAALPWRAPRLVVGHSCVFSWFGAVRGCAPPPKWDRYREETASGLRSAQGVTAPTMAMLHSLWGLYGPFITYGPVYNGRDPAAFPPGEKEPMVFSAGRLWDEAKNTGALETAAEAIPWPVYMAGETEHPDGGRRTLQNVIPLGQIPPHELAGWLARSSIYVLPARYEPFGLTALEAGLAGCALVLGDIPTLREIWGDAALYADPCKPERISAAVNMLIRDPGKMRMLSRKARRRAVQFTPERMARGYVRIYEDLMRGRQSLPAPSAQWKIPTITEEMQAEKRVSP